MSKFLSITLIVVTILIGGCDGEKQDIPLVAIVNYGQIPPLLSSINGIRKELSEAGFTEGKNIRYEIADVAFDHSIIPQTVMNLKSHNPKVMVVMSTPIAQFTKGKIHDIPVVYNVVTDPVAAKLINSPTKSTDNIVGSSDMQNLSAFLGFVKSILPNATSVGMLYLTSDSNDNVLIDMMRKEADLLGMSVIAIPVDQIRDIPVRLQELRGKADLIYVGASGLQSALPVISGEAGKMGIPVFNMEEQSVRDGLAVASFGVNYEAVGKNAGKLIAALLKGTSVKDLSPVYPKIDDHMCFINKKLAEKFGIKIPKNAMVVE
jgi:putative ABC transport system substrate-binding protein